MNSILSIARGSTPLKDTWPLATSTALLFLISMVSLGVGATAIPLSACVGILFDAIGIEGVFEFGADQAAVLLNIRLPRVALGLLVGSGLAVSGAAMQGLFRNPLADPGLVGVSSGAALFAVASIVLAGAVELSFVPRVLLLPLAAFAGGLCTTLLVARLARLRGVTTVTTMLLAGIAINALAQSGTGFLIFMANDAQLRTITFWNLGGLGGATWPTVIAATPFVFSALFFLPRLGRAMNALSLGERAAGHLGVRVERLKRAAVFFSALAVGAAVATAGLIAFVGLVVPHLWRLLIGPDHRTLFPGAALLGGALVIGADLLARVVVAPAELPVGIVTAAIGAPFFIWLLVSREATGGRP
jgi:iron complex transport system permease protein